MLHRYNLNVIYLPGKDMVIADLLSRNFLNETYDNEIPLEGYVHNIYQEIPLLNIELIAEKTVTDKNLCDVIHYCVNGWPKGKDNFPSDDVFVKHFFNIRNDLIVENNILYYNNRVVIPKEMREKALKVLHEGHMGLTKTLLRANQTIYWIGIKNDIEQHIAKCIMCQENRPAKPREPLLSHELAEQPFQKLSLDIMTFKNVDYLVIIDNYSKWIEMFKLNTKRCSEIIAKLKVLFSTFGIPTSILSDNSPFLSREIKEFSREYNIEWKTSSPNYPTSNGQAERAVQVCKDILKKSDKLKVDFRNLL
uniref:RNA-directed DNA polymerase n=1 Tax=Cacopsylla melanoneura TaxID=428564 RepID=A0A8D8Y6E3_9HEMI